MSISESGYNSQTIPVNFKVDGWYWGNLLLGGVIGMLIVDPATGAMYKLENGFQSVTLHKSRNGDSASLSPELKVLDIANVPSKWINKLERIN